MLNTRLLDGFRNETGVKLVERTVEQSCDVSRHLFRLLQTRFDLLRHSRCVRQIVVVSNLYSHDDTVNYTVIHVWLSGLVVSALGMRTRRPRFESRVAPLFHWVATLGKLFTHIASPISQLQETGVQKVVFGA